MVLLYVDILGMKARWKSGDINLVKRAFSTFDEVIWEALSAADEGVQKRVSGGVQSDAAALVFETANDAVLVGRALFQAAFRRGTESERFWLRGVIVPVESPELESSVALPEPASNVKKRVFCDGLMNAINHEQSGFGGQRLLIAESLVDKELEYNCLTEVRPTGDYPRSIFHLVALNHTEAVPDFRDVLWMVPEKIEGWDAQSERMARRLRWTAADRDEFRHASLTTLVFEECEAIINSIGRD